jgi:hypothetical protein
MALNVDSLIPPSPWTQAFRATQFKSPQKEDFYEAMAVTLENFWVIDQQ